MSPDDTAPARHYIDHDAVLLDLIRPLLLHEEFGVLAPEFLSRLAHFFGCERACLGFVTNGSVKVCAVSQHYQPIASPALPEVAAAMEESIRQDTMLAYPLAPDDFPHIVIAHAELARLNTSTSILTFPLGHREELIGAITLECRKPQVLTADQRWIVEQLALHAAPLLKLRRSLEQPLSVRCMEALRKMFSGHHNGKLRRMRLLAVAAFIACAAALLLVPSPYEVAGEARLDAMVQRVISAPIDGYLKEVRVRPGDKVQAQQVLAELNDELLRTEYRKLEAEAVQQENALADAMVKADRTQVALRRAKLDEILAQKDLAAQQLQHTQLLAPFDGVVIKGDLTQLLDSPLKRGDVLLTLSRGPEFRVIVEIPEREIEDIKPEQRGKLVLAAMPAEQFGIRIVRVSPVATVSSDGQNVFEVEAAFNSNATKLVPGLKGVAKITTDDKSLGWHWLKRAWHRLSFIVWSNLG
jgi:multidrug resistance efflux pump